MKQRKTTGEDTVTFQGTPSLKAGNSPSGNWKPSIRRKFGPTDIQTAFPSPRRKYEEALHVYRLWRIVPVRVSLHHEPKLGYPAASPGLAVFSKLSRKVEIPRGGEPSAKRRSPVATSRKSRRSVR